MRAVWKGEPGRPPPLNTRTSVPSQCLQAICEVVPVPGSVPGTGTTSQMACKHCLGTLVRVFRGGGLPGSPFQTARIGANSTKPHQTRPNLTKPDHKT